MLPFIPIRTCFAVATLQEHVIEIIVYLFLTGGAVALIGLVTYAIYVFRNVSRTLGEIRNAVKPACDAMDSVKTLLDCVASTLSGVESALDRMPQPCGLPTAPPVPAAVPPTTPVPRGGCPRCGGQFKWPPVSSEITETGAVLTLMCGDCGKTSCLPTG